MPHTLETQTCLSSDGKTQTDVPAFNAELDREKQDAAYLSGVRTSVYKTLQGLTESG